MFSGGNNTMALKDFKVIVMSRKGVIRELYEEMKAELAAIRAGIPEADSITAAMMKVGIVGYAKLDQNTKRFTETVRIAADAAAADVPERGIYVAHAAVKVIAIDIIPDTQFGQATNYAGLSVINKKADASGTDVLASKNFNGSNVADAFKATSLGTVSTPDLAAGDVLTLKKAKTGDGQIVPNAAIEITFERAA
jgi:hypothetical protein